jgi:hypothetical protein
MTEREYKKLVLGEFDRRWSAQTLPPELITTTRKSLKELSIEACAQRFDSRDEPLLGSFFGIKENRAAYQIAIQNSKAEEFRTLNNFLNDRTIEPSLKNINMLAWLMDFRPRPFHPDLKMPIETQQPVSSITVDEDSEVLINLPEPQKRQPPTRKYAKIMVYMLIVIGFCIAGYFLINRSTGNEKCMYWDVDHYEPISCDKRPSDTTLTVIALDKTKLQHFKKITRPDTLTAASIGNVWYVKINGDVEYYTAEGQHPLYPERRLLKLTATILNVHYNSRVK